MSPTPTNKLIVVIGATGNQGGSVARLFASERGWTVRGITRDTSTESSLALSSLGVQMVPANLDEPSTLFPAFAGASALFCVTDFWAPFYNTFTATLLKEGQTLGQYCYEKELRQWKNIADVAAKIEGLERIVASSLVDAEKLSKGKYKGVYHWDSKARGVEYLREVYPELAKKMTVVMMGNYMGNWKRDLKLQRQKDGKYRLGLVGSGNVPFPNIDVEKDTGYIVRAAIQSSPEKAILAAGSMISWSDQLKVWCELNSVPFGGFDPIPIEVFDRFFPIPGLGRELGEMMAFMDEFGYAGCEADVVLPSELGVPCRLTSWEEYVEEQNWSHILNA